MADPLSIAASIAAVSTLAWQISTTLYKFVSDTLEVDDTIQSLHYEVTNLAKVIRSIEGLLDNVKLSQLKQIELWANIDDCVKACLRTITKLNDIILKAGPPNKQSSFFKKAYQQLKLNLSQPGVTELRAQINTHTSTLQLAFSMINVHLTSTAPDIVIDELGPKLDVLMKQNEKLTSALAAMTLESQEQKALRRLQQSANAITSSASVVMDSGSTVWGGSQIDERESLPSYASEPRRNSLTTGSELGDPLRDDQVSSISNWLHHRTAPLDPLHETHEFPTAEDSRAPLWHDDEDHAHSDDELEIQLIEGHLKIGKRKMLSAADLDASEAALERALAGIRKLHASNQSRFDKKKIATDLIALYAKQRKFAEAQRICEELRQDALAQGDDASSALEASYLLAHTCFLQNQFEAAAVECRQIIKAQGRIGETGNAEVYHDTLALLMRVHEATDNHADAKALSTMLPAGYVKPDFNQDLGLAKSATVVEEITPVSTRASFAQGRKQNPRTSGIPVLSDEEARAASQTLHTQCPFKISPENADLDKALLWAAENGHAQLVALLLDDKTLFKSMWSSKWKSAKSSRPTIQGVQKALEAAVEGGHGRIVWHLVDEGGITSLQKPLKLRDKIKMPEKSFPGLGDFGSATSLIHLAAVSPDGAGSLRALAAKGVEVGTPTTNGSTPALLASFLGHATHLDVLLDLHADASTENSAGYAPLGAAVASGNTAVVEILLTSHAALARGAGFATVPDAKKFKPRAPLQAAVMQGSLQMVQRLVEAGASASPVSTADGFPSGEIPLHTAAQSGNAEILGLLLAQGADTAVRDARERTALHVAAAEGQGACVAALLAKGADPSTKDREGCTPVFLAAQAGALECVKRLDRGSVNVKNDEGLTPFLAAARSGSVNVLRALLDLGADATVVDKKGTTALMSAAKGGHEEACEWLVSKVKGTIKARDQYGRTAYECARSVKIKRMLRRQGLGPLKRHRRRGAGRGGGGGQNEDEEEDDDDDDEEP